jgi:hypothetical protein
MDGIVVAAAEGMGSAMVFEVQGSEAIPGPQVDPWLAHVCAVGEHLVCAGARQLVIACRSRG